MHTEATIIAYLKALGDSDYDYIVSLFSDDAYINSPLYGKMPVKEFYRRYFSDNSRSKTMLINIFTSDNPFIAACHFRCERKRKDGSERVFECVDVFQFNEHSKITELTMIYDTAMIERSFENMNENINKNKK